MATLKSTGDGLNRLAKLVDTKFAKQIPFVVLNQAKAILKNRVFSRRLAADNSITGKYKSASYRKKNKKVGFNVDLQRSGSLLNSIQVGQFGNGLALGFTNDKTAQYARFNEVRYRNSEDTIFVLNGKETDEAIKAGERYMDKEIDKWLKTF